MVINVNGINLFYEKSGQGSPFILLHGNGEDHTIFDVLTARLSQSYTVYAPDSRGHGQSGRVKILNYRDMARDAAAFIQALGIEKPILYGFSDGGIIGLLLAAEHPDMLSRLIVSGANTRPDGIKTIFTVLMKIAYFFTRDKKLKLMLTQPDITAAELNKIVTPTLVLAGSSDFVRDEHTRMIAAGINDSALRILEGESHGSYVLHSGKLFDIIEPFLTGAGENLE